MEITKIVYKSSLEVFRGGSKAERLETLEDHRFFFLTCLTVMLDLFPLISKGSEPALFLLRLLRTQEVDLITGQRAQLQSVLHTDVELLLFAVLHIYHLHVVHVHPTLIVEHVSAQ